MDRRGKNIFGLFTRPTEVASCVSLSCLSLKLTKLRHHELCWFSSVKIRPKPVNAVKCPPCVPPGEKSFWHWRCTRFCTSTPNFIRLSFSLTKLRSHEAHYLVCPSKSPLVQYGGIKYGRQGKNLIIIFIRTKIPHHFIIDHHSQ